MLWGIQNQLRFFCTGYLGKLVPQHDVNRATNNQAYQSCINTLCTVPNRSACSKDGWPWRGTEECSLVGCHMELYEDVFQNSLFFVRSKLAWAHI
jgi:hypothetical protein